MVVASFTGHKRKQSTKDLLNLSVFVKIHFSNFEILRKDTLLLEFFLFRGTGETSIPFQLACVFSLETIRLRMKILYKS